MKQRQCRPAVIFLAFSIIFFTFSIFFALSTQVTASDEDPLHDAVFFGESTTTHLRSRGGIPDDRVLANESGTMRLDSTIFSRTVRNPKNQKQEPLLQVIEALRPTRLILSFGLNGIADFSKDCDRYVGCYQKLIDRILEVSPDTRITVQSVYPVADAEHQLNWNFSASPMEINHSIMRLNGWLSEMCQSMEGVDYADTASALTDANGFLAEEFTTDGIHLTETAYKAILSALRAQFSSNA